MLAPVVVNHISTPLPGGSMSPGTNVYCAYVPEGKSPNVVTTSTGGALTSGLVLVSMVPSGFVNTI